MLAATLHEALARMPSALPQGIRLVCAHSNVNSIDDDAVRQRLFLYAASSRVGDQPWHVVDHKEMAADSWRLFFALEIFAHDRSCSH
jgi:hypothetical protein